MSEDGKTARSGTGDNRSREDEEKASREALGITMDKRMDLAVAVGVAIVGALMLIGIRGMRRGTVPDPVTSRGLPILVGAFLAIGGIVQAVRQLLTWRVLPGHLVPEEGQEDERGYPSSAIRAIIIILLSMLWELLLDPLGFLIITPLYLVACSLVMGVRSWRKIIGFSLVYSVASWFGFGSLLGVRLPLGPFDHLARSLGLIL